MPNPRLALADAAEQRANAATPGPYRLQENVAWVFAPDGNREVVVHATPLDDVWEANAGDYRKQQKANARFFTHARTDVPALATAVRELVAQLNSANKRTVNLVEAAFMEGVAKGRGCKDHHPTSIWFVSDAREAVEKLRGGA